MTIEAAAHAGSKIRISVRDSGCGIPAEIDVFEMFRTTKKAGSGLGLAISSELAAGQGGTLVCEANKPRGTVFHLDLPGSPARRRARRTVQPRSSPIIV